MVTSSRRGTCERNVLDGQSACTCRYGAVKPYAHTVRHQEDVVFLPGLVPACVVASVCAVSIVHIDHTHTHFVLTRKYRITIRAN